MKSGFFLCAKVVALAGTLLIAGCNFGKDKEEAAAVGEPQLTVEGGRVVVAADPEEFLETLRDGVRRKDYGLLASLMTPTFGYQLSPPLEGEGVFEYWDENLMWPEIDRIVHQPFSEFQGFQVAPPEFAQDPQGYVGVRTGIVQVGNKWRWAYLVP